MTAKETQRLKSKIVGLYRDNVKNYVRNLDSDGLTSFFDNINLFRKMLKAGGEDFICMKNLLERSLKSADFNPKEISLLVIFMYLLLAEGSVCNYLSFVSYLLVARGHDLFSYTKRKYVKDSMNEIMKVEMWAKIKFLNHCGFGALTKEYDSTFRNDIAHHNYEIDDKGIIWVRGKSVDLEPKLDSLLKLLALMDETLGEIRKNMGKILTKMKKNEV